METTHDSFKDRFWKELRLFLIYATFLSFFFCSLITYKRLLLNEYAISYFHYGYGILQALILSKIILLGQSLGLGNSYNNKPLIIPTLYKAAVFSLFVLVFTIIEHFIVGLIKGVDLAKTYEKLTADGIDTDLAKIQIVFLVFVLFFAFMEMSRVLGEKKLVELFIRRRDESNK